MNCAWQGERITRHNSLRDVLHSTAVKAALGPTKEGQYLLPGEGGKPADIFIPRHAGGKDAALDVTVVNPLQAALVSQAAETPGHALKVAHKRKLDKSWQACNQQGMTRNRMRVAIQSVCVTKILALQRWSKIDFPPEFQTRQMHSFPIMYNTMGSKVDGLAVRDHFLPKKWPKNSYFGGHNSGSTDFREGWDPNFQRYR